MIDTDAIRCKVLELAMRGKLSIGLVGDSDFSDRYKNIAIMDGNEIPYALPTTWIWVRIKDVISKDVGGGTPNKSIEEYWKNGDIPWASVKDFSSAEGGYLKDTIDHITQEGLDNSSAHMVDEDAIVICMRMALGKIVKVAKPMAINQDLRAIWLNELADKDYFVYFYSTLKVEGRGMTVAGIRKDELMNYLIPLPSIEEQKRIVKRINGIFDILNTIEELQDSYFSNIEILKGKLIDVGIQGKLTEQLPEDGTAEELLSQIADERKKQESEGKIKKVDKQPVISDEEIPFIVPYNWKWVRFGDASYIVRGGSPRPIKQYITNEENGINWIKISDVEKGSKYILETQEKIIPEGEKKSRKVYPDDFLLTNSMSYGRPYISKIEGCIHDGWLLIHSLKGFDQDYLYYLLSSGYLYSQFTQKASGSTVDNLNIDKVSSAIIPLPPLAEQKRIANRIEELLQYCQ